MLECTCTYKPDYVCQLDFVNGHRVCVCRVLHIITASHRTMKLPTMPCTMRLIWHYYQSDELRNIECRVFGVCAMIHLMPFTWRSFGHKNPNTPASVASCRCMLVGWDWIKRSIFEYCNTPIYLFIYSAKHFNSRCCPGVDWQLCCFPSMVGRSVCFFCCGFYWKAEPRCQSHDWKYTEFHEPQTELGN